MLSHVEEVSKAPLPDQAQLDTLRSNVAKQQQKVEQLSTPQPSANGAQVLPCCLTLPCCLHIPPPLTQTQLSTSIAVLHLDLIAGHGTLLHAVSFCKTGDGCATRHS